MESNNAYARINDTKTEAIEKVKSGIQKYLIWIVLLFNIALEIMTRLYSFGFQNPFTPDFFMSVFIDTVSTMICYACFIIIGQNDEKKKSLTYINNVRAWGELSNEVRSAHLQPFREFCVEQVNEERDEAKRLILANDTIIPFDVYKKEYEHLNKAELKQLYEQGTISKEEYRALYRANGFGLFNPTKIKPINPVIILSGVAKTTLNDAGRSESNYVVRWLTARPILIFATTTVLNTITTSFVGVNQNAILSMFISVLSIVVASIIGYGAGQQAVREREDRIKSRIIFLSLFKQKRG